VLLTGNGLGLEHAQGSYDEKLFVCCFRETECWSLPTFDLVENQLDFAETPTHSQGPKSPSKVPSQPSLETEPYSILRIFQHVTLVCRSLWVYTLCQLTKLGSAGGYPTAHLCRTLHIYANAQGGYTSAKRQCQHAFSLPDWIVVIGRGIA